MPEISADNEELMDLLTLCAGQWLHGFAGPTGLNWQVIIEVADRIGIETDEGFFRRLRSFEAAAVEAMGKKS